MNQRPTCEGLACHNVVDYFVTFQKQFLGEAFRSNHTPPWGIRVPKDPKEGMVLCNACLGLFQQMAEKTKRLDDLERNAFKRNVRKLVG